MAPLCRVIVCPETSRLDTPPVSSSHGWGKLGEVEKVLEELEKTRLAAAEVKEGEDWNWEVGVPPPLVVLFSSSCVAEKLDQSGRRSRSDEQTWSRSMSVLKSSPPLSPPPDPPCSTRS